MNTRDNRASVMLLALPFGRALPLPQGTLDGADRQQVAFFYRGILAEPVSNESIPPGRTLVVAWHSRRIAARPYSRVVTLH